jgi:hypothetical protein
VSAFATGAKAVVASEMPRTARAAKIAFFVFGLLDVLRPRRSRVAWLISSQSGAAFFASAALTGGTLPESVRRRSESIHSLDESFCAGPRRWSGCHTVAQSATLR